MSWSCSKSSSGRATARLCPAEPADIFVFDFQAIKLFCLFLLFLSEKCGSRNSKQNRKINRILICGVDSGADRKVMQWSHQIKLKSSSNWYFQRRRKYPFFSRMILYAKQTANDESSVKFGNLRTVNMQIAGGLRFKTAHQKTNP